uniref:(California timema) hypothetical protein n=1 Tax=Timema californicum TaxID=61474 RepID=A0A7R9J9N4_TIMCA|nr:unnamed protein product [Timema californicum]
MEMIIMLELLLAWPCGTSFFVSDPAWIEPRATSRLKAPLSLLCRALKSGGQSTCSCVGVHQGDLYPDRSQNGSRRNTLCKAPTLHISDDPSSSRPVPLDNKAHLVWSISFFDRWHSPILSHQNQKGEGGTHTRTSSFTSPRELGLVETISIANPLFGSKANSIIGINPLLLQQFDYLIVIDFESTCWEGEQGGWKQPEIIEFPAVLLNIHSGQLEQEFQQYVCPIENPKLSEFCKSLTGITQQQVDDGVPLSTCLLLFSRWINIIKQNKNLKFHGNSTQKSENERLCTFVTWSGCIKLRYRAPIITAEKIPFNQLSIAPCSSTN